MASLAIQVFGGVGFIEENGVASALSRHRIAPIYEGTNGIQAMDLAGHKLHADGGEHWLRLLDDLSAVVVWVAKRRGPWDYPWRGSTRP